MSSFFTHTPAGNTVHLRGNPSDAALARLNTMFDLAISQATAEIEIQAYTPLEATYAGLEIISQRLETRTVHYRDGNGRLLTTLDEVCRWLQDSPTSDSATGRK